MARPGVGASLQGTVDDYLLDTGKLRRTRQERFLNPAKLVMIYTSTMASGHILSLDVSPTSYRIVPGAKATLFVHQSYSPADETVAEGEGEEVPLVNETLAMRDERRWKAGKLGKADWRISALASYPVMVGIYRTVGQ